MNNKLYMVVRGDLDPGDIACQAYHAGRQFAADFPSIEREWFEKSNHVAILSVRNEQELNRLIVKAREREIPYSCFREPDLNNSLTAIALEPGDRSRRLCSGLDLALKKIEAHAL